MPYSSSKIQLAVTSAALLVFITFSTLSVAATQDSLELEEVLVTAPTYQSVSSVPHNVSVITAQDIDKSQALSLADLLSREANLNLKSYFGNDKNATIDMRGMGDTAVSNVLIMVDGVKLNESDLSGADLSTVPLSQVERIEIIRGGGSVLYGDGAVGGVINIITRRGKVGSKTMSFEAARGSYNTDDFRFNGNVSEGMLAATLNASQFSTDGFRKNGSLDSKNVSFELRMLPMESLSFLSAYVRIAHHEDEYGLPGSVSKADFLASTSSRRTTQKPFDGGTTNDDRYTLGVNADFEQAGRIEWQYTLRERDNNYIQDFNPLLTRDEQQRSINSQRINMSLKYLNDFKLFSLPSTFIMGIDTLSGDYVTYNADKNRPNTLKQVGNINSQGFYASSTINVTPSLDFSTGIRVDRLTTDFKQQIFKQTCSVININVSPFQIQGPCNPYAYQTTNSSTNRWDNHSAEIGAVWKINPLLNAFTSWTQHFRSPNVDELAQAAVDLRPQTGKTIETGLKYSNGSTLEGSFTLFDISIRDEIYFGSDPASGFTNNRNYEQKTNRQGAELEVRWHIQPAMTLKGNAGYVAPEFEGTKADIPNVPRRTFNAQAEWKPIERLSWIFSGRYVGSRFDGNDPNNNQFAKQSSYAVYDTSLSLNLNQADLIVGVNNIFDQAYSTLAYSETYYPMPERNAFVKLKIKY